MRPSQPWSPLIDGEYLLFRERLLRETLRSLYCGFELDYQGLNRVNYIDTVTAFALPDVRAMGSNNLCIGLVLLYNIIHIAMDLREGLYSQWAFMNYNAAAGSD